MIPKTKQRGARRGTGKRSVQRRDNAPMPVVPRIALGNNLMFGFPSRILTKLRYVDTYALVSTSGTVAKQVLYLNSTFDPDNTGTGHQPLYRDTYAAVYDEYAVVSTKAIIDFQSLATGTGLSCGAVIDDDNSTSSTVTTLMEQNNGKHMLLPPLLGSLSNRTITINWDCEKHLGINPYTSSEYKTPVGSNPTVLASLLLWSAPADGSSTTTNQVQVTLEQTVLWTELSTPTQS